jgi:hypothetical protein
VTLPDWKAFAHDLGAALAAPEPEQRLNDLLFRVLATEPSGWESDEQRLVRVIAGRVDAADAGSMRRLALARNVQALLDNASSIDAVVLLLELVAERERVLGVLHKHLHGTVSRTGLLSFIAEQRWPESVRQRVAALTESDIAGLLSSLEMNNIGQLETALAS